MDAAHKWGASFSIPTAVKESFRGLIRDAGRFAPGLFGSRDTQESTSFLIWAAGPPKWQNPLARLLAGLRFDIYPSNLAQLRDVEIKDVQRVADDERPQRRGRPPRGEQPVHPSVAQQVHADERVRAGDHSRDQGADLRRRFDPADPGTRTWVPTNSWSRACSANASTGTSPAHETRFGSSKPAETLWKTLACRMSFCLVRWTLNRSHRPRSEGHSSFRISPRDRIRRCIQAQRRRLNPGAQLAGKEDVGHEGPYCMRSPCPPISQRARCRYPTATGTDRRASHTMSLIPKVGSTRCLPNVDTSARLSMSER